LKYPDPCRLNSGQNGFSPMKPRAAVILFEGDQIAMIERYRGTAHYFVFPGGKIDADETPEAAAAREIKEELGLEVRVGKMVAEIWYQNTPQYYFLAERIGGVFGSGTGKEMASLPDSPKGSHLPIWLPVKDLLTERVLPSLMVSYVFTYSPDRWPDKPFIVKVEQPEE